MSIVRQYATSGAGANTNGSASRNGANIDALQNSGMTAESQAQIPCRTSGTYSQLYGRNLVTPTATCTVRFRVDTANGNQLLTVTASGEYTDETHTDAVTAGSTSKTNFQYVTGGTTQAQFTGVGVSFTPTSGTVKRFGGYNGASVPTSSTTVYFCAGSGSSTTEADAQLKIRTGGTLQNMSCNVSGAPANTATFRVRVGGADGNQVISVTGTGLQEDNTHTDTVSATNLINFSWSSGASTVAAVRVVSVELSTADSSWVFFGGNTSGVTQAANVTNYLPITGDCGANATEANLNILADTAFTVQDVGIRVKTNTVTSASTLKLRKNSGSGNGSASIGSSTTGWIEDTTNTDAIVATDEINYQLVTPNSGTSMIYTATGAAVVQTVAGGVTIFKHKHKIM